LKAPRIIITRSRPPSKDKAKIVILIIIFQLIFLLEFPEDGRPPHTNPHLYRPAEGKLDSPGINLGEFLFYELIPEQSIKVPVAFEVKFVLVVLGVGENTTPIPPPLMLELHLMEDELVNGRLGGLELVLLEVVAGLEF
jgi:hypothetical protein